MFTWTPFMRFAVPRARLAVGYAVLAPIALGYRARLVTASTGRQIAARVAFSGASARDVRERGAAYAAAVLPGTIRAEARERIEWHRAQGDRVVVVSASLDVYLAPWCDAHRLEYLCPALEERDGRLTGRYRDGDCAGAHKARKVRERYDLAAFAIIYAYGDTPDDRAMLALAHRRFYQWQELPSRRQRALPQDWRQQ